MTVQQTGTDWYQNVWTSPGQSLTFGGVGEDLFRDVEFVLCCSGPVLHPSPALHGEVDITGNC